MMALTGHVATTVPPVGDDTHTVEYSDAMKPPETDADADAERDADPVPDTMDLLAERDADVDAVVDTMKPPVLDADADGDRVGDGVGDTITHCT